MATGHGDGTDGSQDDHGGWSSDDQCSPMVAGQSGCGQTWSDDGDDDHGGPRLGQLAQRGMRKGFVCAGAADAGAEAFLCRSSQPTKAWCKVSRMAKVPHVPSGEKQKAGARVDFGILSSHLPCGLPTARPVRLPSPAQSCPYVPA